MHIGLSLGINGQRRRRPDAAAYIAAVEAADGQALEAGVRAAINAFVSGCKQDGIWSALQACCLMAGARTLSGALVPLKGPAPTNFNFVSGDYSRKTGLIGNGATKYLDSNFTLADFPSNDNTHLSAYVTEAAPVGALCISAAGLISTRRGRYLSREVGPQTPSGSGSGVGRRTM